MAAALEETDQAGGREALLAVLRHVAEAQGMSAVAERAGIPTMTTLLAVLGAAGLKLRVHRTSAA